MRMKSSIQKTHLAPQANIYVWEVSNKIDIYSATGNIRTYEKFHSKKDAEGTEKAMTLTYSFSENVIILFAENFSNQWLEPKHLALTSG